MSHNKYPTLSVLLQLFDRVLHPGHVRAAVLFGGKGQEDGAAFAVAFPEQSVAVGLCSRGRQLDVQPGNGYSDDQGIRARSSGGSAVPHESHFHVAGEALDRLDFNMKLCPVLQ